MGNWFLFLDFYGYRENGLGHETSTKRRQKAALALLLKDLELTTHTGVGFMYFVWRTQKNPETFKSSVSREKP